MFNSEKLWRNFDKFVGIDSSYKARALLLDFYGVDNHKKLLADLSYNKKQLRLWSHPQNAQRVDKQGNESVLRGNIVEIEEELKKYDPNYAKHSIAEDMNSRRLVVLDKYNKILEKLKADDRYSQKLQNFKVFDASAAVDFDAFKKQQRDVYLVIHPDKGGNKSDFVEFDPIATEAKKVFSELEGQVELIKKLDNAMDNKLSYNLWDYSQIALCGGHLIFSLYKEYQDGWQKTAVSCAIAGLEACITKCFSSYVVGEDRFFAMAFKDVLRNVGFAYAEHTESELYWFLNMRFSAFFSESHAISCMSNTLISRCGLFLANTSEDVADCREQIERWKGIGNSYQVAAWTKKMWDTQLGGWSCAILAPMFGVLAAMGCNTIIDYVLVSICKNNSANSTFVDNLSRESEQQDNKVPLMLEGKR